jgi:bacillithiol biosynthesis cysteine-adding enzyme BshC
MQSSAISIAYQKTGFFSSMVLDYISKEPSLKPFYTHHMSIDSALAAISERQAFATNRQLLVNVLQAQYAGVTLNSLQQQHLQALASENCFTVCTAHQPNLFTGHLYFVYKILHAIKLAEEFKQQLPQYDFVPVYYMGSEDADLEELNHITINGQRYQWNTKQTGAVGRMLIDDSLVAVIQQMAGQLLVMPHGQAVIDLLMQSYIPGLTISEATFTMVNQLFAEFGLLILQPDQPALKKAFAPVMQRELLEQFSHPVVQQTAATLPIQYKVQAAGRPLNLFYLHQQMRERIEKIGDAWQVVNTQISFTRLELLRELEQHPERFSPNVILRPVLQETLLPNIAFIGGGGEIAYWLELKNVFAAAGVPYPMLLLRNSFMLTNSQQREQAERLQFNPGDLFYSAATLTDILVKREAALQLELSHEKEQLTQLYQQIKNIAGKIDPTLVQHTEALQVKALKKIIVLEKKMLKAERLKFGVQQSQVHKLKAALFPGNNLQERVENYLGYAAQWGPSLMQQLYQHSQAMAALFTVVNLQEDEVIE